WRRLPARAAQSQGTACGGRGKGPGDRSARQHSKYSRPATYSLQVTQLAAPRDGICTLMNRHASARPDQPATQSAESVAPAATAERRDGPRAPAPILSPSAHMLWERWDELPEFKMNTWRLAGHRIVAATRTHDTHLDIDVL